MLERVQADRPGGSRESGAQPGGQEPNLVGAYLLLAEIARGELTTVHLAKKHDALGFQRLYALKRLKPGLSGSTEHVELLLDEARVMSSLHHANIAGVLDVGSDAGSYLVTEYVEGENLENLLARAGAARHPRYVVPALVDALQGLHALHTAKDAAGEPSGIVHQAPRARHVLVGIDGTARLIDFSQVRAASVRPSRCRSDRLKVAYMAPEQALHPDGVDLRADLFIAGITLWEALTGERLFTGDNDGQTFQNMLHRKVPRPSEVGLKAPACFDAICLRALERDRGKRYESALEMARELREVALNEKLFASSEELGAWVRELAGTELRERRSAVGMEPLSSAGMSLETPTLGFERVAHVPVGGAAPVVAHEGATPRARAAEGGGHSGALVVREVCSARDASETAVTPPVGMRRAPLPREEPSDDAPTGQHASLTEPAESTSGARPSPRSRNEELARAATLPVLAQVNASELQAAAAASAEAPSSVAALDLDAGGEGDQTQPNRFVPARPGARRDGKSVSPGAYSQVDGRRGRAAGTERSASASFDDVETTTHPTLAARAEAAAQRSSTAGERASTTPASAQKSRVSPLAGRRPITEAPPTYVQRRDSNPTRMQIPDGPVGAPHRSFPQDDGDSNVHRVDARASARERNGVDALSVARLNGSRDAGSVPQEDMGSVPQEPVGAEEPEAREQSHPRVRRTDLGLHAGMIDSLSPPMRASLTTAPPAPAARSWPLWLASGVLVAIILLAIGVGIQEWLAGPSRALPSTRHAARAGGPASAAEALAREPAGSPAARSKEPAPPRAAPAELPAAPPELAAESAAPTSRRAQTTAAPAAARAKAAAPVERRPLPRARRATPPQSGETAAKRPAPANPAAAAPAASLPENPY